MKVDQGINNVKEVIKLGSDLANVLKQAKENDGKIDLADLPLVIGLSGSFGPAIADIEKVLPELKDLNAEESKELIAYLGSELTGKFTNKELVRKIEACLKLSVAIADLVKAF